MYQGIERFTSQSEAAQFIEVALAQSSFSPLLRSPILPPSADEELERLRQAFESSQQLSAPIKGLFGRLIRGKSPEEFSSLSSDLERRLVFLLDSEGLSELPGKTGYQMLIHVGHSPTDIHERVIRQGKHYKLAVFRLAKAVRLADWDGIVAAASEAYPEYAETFEHHRLALAHYSLGEIEDQAGFKFSQILETDERYMSCERFSCSEQTLWQTRAFFYHVLQLRALFSGDGYTYTYDGQRGLREYIIPNIELSRLEGSMLIDLAVELPDGEQAL